MFRNFILGILILFTLVSCTPKTDSSVTTSIRFTPLNFPHTNLGEFTLSESFHKEQIDIFLSVIQNTLSTGKTGEVDSLNDFPYTFTLQLFSGIGLTDIYRLSIDSSKDVAYLENEFHIYTLAKLDFYRLIETGYFNVIFHKNYAPTASFYLNDTDIKYAVNGTWNYETYQDNFLSYQINTQPLQTEHYIVNNSEAALQFSFPEKKPDKLYETIYSADNFILNRRPLETNQITVPAEENTYNYEVEAIWDNPDYPYNAVLKYQFKVEVNYPAEVTMLSAATAGSVIPIRIDNFDTNGKISVSSDLWNDEIYLSLAENSFYGLLPVPADTASGDYQFNITGSNSAESLQLTQTVTVSGLADNISNVNAKSWEAPKTEAEIDTFLTRISRLHTRNSYSEKLWNSKFSTPTTVAPKYSFHQTLKHKDQLYRFKRLSFPVLDSYPVRASESGIVAFVEELEDNRYLLLVDHGLGVYSFYYNLSDISVSVGSYLTPKQELGYFRIQDSKDKTGFSYGMIVNGVFTNPNAFRNRDPFLNLK